MRLRMIRKVYAALRNKIWYWKHAKLLKKLPHTEGFIWVRAHPFGEDSDKSI